MEKIIKTSGTNVEELKHQIKEIFNSGIFDSMFFEQKKVEQPDTPELLELRKKRRTAAVKAFLSNSNESTYD